MWLFVAEHVNGRSLFVVSDSIVHREFMVVWIFLFLDPPSPPTEKVDDVQKSVMQ